MISGSGSAHARVMESGVSAAAAAPDSKNERLDQRGMHATSGAGEIVARALLSLGKREGRTPMRPPYGRPAARRRQSLHVLELVSLRVDGDSFDRVAGREAVRDAVLVAESRIRIHVACAVHVVADIRSGVR